MAGDVEEHRLLSSCWYRVGLQTFWSWIHLGGEKLHRWVGCAALWGQEGPRPPCPARDIQSEPWAWGELTGLSRDLLERIPWECALEGRGIPESWVISKDHFFQTQ